MSDLASRLARVEERIEAMRDATSLAKVEVDRRLAEMNELRRQIESERGRFVEKEIYDQGQGAMRERVGNLESRVATMEGGRQLRASAIGWALAGMAVLVAITVAILNAIGG